MNRNFVPKSKISLFTPDSNTTTPSQSTKRTSYSDSQDEDTEDILDEDDMSTSDDGVPEGILMNHENNAVKWVIGTEAYCFDVTKFAGKLVEATYVEARKQLYSKPRVYTHLDIVKPILSDIINKILPKKIIQTEETHESSSNMSYNFSTNSMEPWPKISEFNIKLGLERVEDYVKTWERLEEWMFCVEFLGFECEDCSNVFVYEVEWSKPTKAYPIPQATASVYFALEVFKMVPFHYDRAIEVTYVFETTNVIHVPGRTDFQEKWLQDIIDSKSMFFKTVTFGIPKGYCQINEDEEEN